MAVESITANYTQAEDTAEVTIIVSGLSNTAMTATAADILTARTQVDQLIEQNAPTNGSTPVVVHLLNGSAVAFTHAYLAAAFNQPSTGQT